VILLCTGALDNVLAIGGYTLEQRNTIISSVETLIGGNEQCAQVEDYPFEVTGATAAFLDDRVMVCGGYVNYPDMANALVSTNECKELTFADGTWTVMESLPIPIVYFRWDTHLDET